MRRVCFAIVLGALVGCGGGGGGTDGGKKDAKSDGTGAAGTGAAGSGTAGTSVAGTGAAGTGAAGTGAAGTSTPEPAPDGSVGDADAGAPAGDAADATEAGNDLAGADVVDSAETAEPQTVTVAFAGQVVTVAPAPDGGMPLGFSSAVRTKPVSGTFSYNLGYVDDVAPATQGKFERFGKMSFDMTIEGHKVTGSGKGWLETVNVTGSDTFRFVDGDQPLDNGVRTMKLDNVDSPLMSLWISISDSTGAMLASDKLPAPFPPIDIKANTITHTFKLSDPGGTLLMQLDTLANQ